MAHGDKNSGGNIFLMKARVDARHLHEARERAREVMELLGVDELAARDIMTLSTGQARRVLIARALVHDPDAVSYTHLVLASGRGQAAAIRDADEVLDLFDVQ